MKSSDNAEPKIIYCDNHLLIAEKPTGWLTQPDDTGAVSLEQYCKNWVKREFHKPGDVFLHAIHRLDRPVFGLVLFARTSKALSRLNEMSRAQQIRRLYTAKIEGFLSAKEGTLEHYLVHGDHRANVVQAHHPEAKQAILSYKVEREEQNHTVILIELQTGRYHQIRAQFGAIGHSIVGDRRYGAKEGSNDRIALGCTELIFLHPVTKQPLHFRSCIFVDSAPS